VRRQRILYFLDVLLHSLIGMLEVGPFSASAEYEAETQQ
jgi:hypothetical protein